MLLQIRYSETSISLIVNGEQVGEVFIESENLTFPTELGTNQRNQDYLGFYAHEDIQPIEVEAVAIYGYKVPVQVAKRRFVYGQGVEFPENINNAYSGSSIFIDYPFSKYSKNYSYPNIGRWAQGSYDGLILDGNCLSFPDYQKPIVRLSSGESSSWLSDLQQSQVEGDTFIELRPSEDWGQVDGHIFIEDFSLSSEPARAFYAVLEDTVESTDRQTIVAIKDLVGSCLLYTSPSPRDRG